MVESAYVLIFWYGILHAFGPDHLSVIADFSIGKSMKRTMSITMLFAFGHGLMLFVFAKLLERFEIPEHITDYGDLISSGVIIAMGLYLLYMVYADKIEITKHTHAGEEHIHIYYADKHTHKESIVSSSALGMGALMGIGGVRGMLVTLGVIGTNAVDLSMVFSFVFGVSIVFLAFGGVILYLNRELLTNKKNLNRAYTTAGIVSVVVGANMIFA